MDCQIPCQSPIGSPTCLSQKIEVSLGYEGSLFAACQGRWKPCQMGTDAEL